MVSEIHWFAFRVLHNKSVGIIKKLQEDGIRYFVPVRTVEKLTNHGLEYIEEPVFTSLLFVQCTISYVQALRKNSEVSILVYFRPGTTEPAIIPDREMEIFMHVITTGSQRLDVVDEKLLKGDKVRITDGIFKGLEGFITRVHGTKRFVVVVEGIAAVATSYIPRSFIEKIT